MILLALNIHLSAQSLHITGQYLDKKSNSVANALITYYAQGDLLVDSSRSLSNGNFSLTLDLTGIENQSQTNSPFVELPHPNPFNGLTNFVVNVADNAYILVTSIQGLQVDKLELKNPGTYQCSWGGQNRIGQQLSKGTYNISLIIGNTLTTHKVLFDGNASQRLKSNKISAYNNYKEQNISQDRINFLKSNTSELDVFINTISGDTTLGVITGNIGPEALSNIIATVHIDNTNTWYLNEYFYNDDQSIYTTTNSDFTISSDSIMTYIGTDVGFFEFDILATDPQQPDLISQTLAQITVTNQQIFTCSGTYLDKQQQPIAGATITYWEDGTTYNSQTTSGSTGFWSMDVTTSGTAEDKLEFVKTNTSTLELFFATPSADTTFGDVTGNIGPEAINSINETYTTIDGELLWNLNNYFTNDDQNIYSFTGNTYYLSQDTLLGLSTQNQGTFNTAVTATDPQDATLTAQITADVTVEYTLNIPDTDIIEDFDGDTVFADLNQFKNPNCTQNLTYSIISQSNSQLIDLYVQNNAILINTLQADNSGSSYVGVEITSSNDVETIYFTVSVNPMPDVSGYITDILDTLNIGLEGVSIEMTLDSITFYNTTTDVNGYYSIQLPEASETSYYVTTITKAGYTPFHTWATVDAGSNDITEDYTIIHSSFVWDLYNNGFRDTTDLNGGFPASMKVTTHHWVSPPPIHTYSDNALVGGTDITIQYNNLVYNINNILPTFNPRDALPSNIIEHTLFSQHTLQDGDMGAYFDDSIYPAAGIVARIYDGPKMNRCSTAYYHTIGETGGSAPGADNWVFNQELGSCFGSVAEPAQSSNYNSVFTTPTSFSTYTSDDYDCSTVMLDRARVHYKNLSLSGQNAYDWEMRPDEVLTWYPGTSKNVSQKRLEYKVIGQNGEILEKGTYPIDDVPSRVMKMAKIMFTAEQIAAREKEESRLGFELRTWLKSNVRKTQTNDAPQQTKPKLTKRELRKMKREGRKRNSR